MRHLGKTCDRRAVGNELRQSLLLWLRTRGCGGGEGLHADYRSIELEQVQRSELPVSSKCNAKSLSRPSSSSSAGATVQGGSSE
eukprot:3812258-Prymnesium_polylepis.1